MIRPSHSLPCGANERARKMLSITRYKYARNWHKPGGHYVATQGIALLSPIQIISCRFWTKFCLKFVYHYIYTSSLD
jgi:hypothetical protein